MNAGMKQDRWPDLPDERKLMVTPVSEALEQRFEITRADGSKEKHIVQVQSSDVVGTADFQIATLHVGDTVRALNPWE